ncbi:uncharacterized protein LOC143609668 [Bidens hawaiensis]|uniref:uncharacterized protein LOC143609668 n=1 Tax=Bidens hawaiensis TaxID=980011 RepID=UPI00404A327B
MDEVESQENDLGKEATATIEVGMVIGGEVEGESVDHITTGCGVAAVVWEHISRWCKVPPIYGFSVRDFLELHKSIKLGDLEKDAFHGIIVIAYWSIWKARNNKVFKGIEIKVEDIIIDIKSLGFLWF